MRNPAAATALKLVARSTGPRRFGRYELHDEIAAGGMAQIHLGWLSGDAGFGRVVAVKRLRSQLARDPDFVAMLLDESRVAARVRHPFALAPIDAVADGDDLFLVLEYVQGETLADLHRRALAAGVRMPVPVAVAVLSNVLAALHAAHEAKDDAGRALDVVHRDVSPQNVLVGVDGIARLLDFGVAKAARRMHQTRAGHVKGKLGYMAPEQLVPGEPVTRAIDVYAASVILWEALCGQRMFEAENDLQLAAKLTEGAPYAPGSRVAEVPSALDGVVMRGLASDPKRRFPTALAMADALAGSASMASPGDVARWIAQVAGDSLAKRAERVAALERRASTTGSRSRDAETFLARFPQNAESGVLRAAVRVTPLPIAPEAPIATPARSGAVAIVPRLTREPAVQVRLNPQDRGSWALSLGLALLGACVVLATLVVIFGGAKGAAVAASHAPAPATPADVPHVVAPEAPPPVAGIAEPPGITIVQGEPPPAPSASARRPARTPGSAAKHHLRRGPRPL